ncbi:MAG TPA: TerD family protein [Nocardioides sp.]|nr:TerD family protein [Nocardioides sp.]
MTTLVRGANTVVAGPDQAGVVIGARWETGTTECDLVVLVCDEQRKVLTDEHFVFFNNPVSPDRAVVVRQTSTPEPGGDVAQAQIHLSGMPANAHRVVVALAALADGASLDPVAGIGATAFNPRGGEVSASYDVGAEKAGTACLILVELYRHSGAWKLRAVGQGYGTGLRGLGRDYGVDIA